MALLGSRYSQTLQSRCPLGNGDRDLLLKGVLWTRKLNLGVISTQVIGATLEVDEIPRERI